MRSIYSNHNGWVRLQQGALFSGAIADGIENSNDVLGLIITPRCDIANRKVSTIHYLPVIPFKLWKYEILSRLYQSVEYEKLTKKLTEFCTNHTISETIFDKTYGFTETDIESSISHVPGYKDVLNKFRDRSKLDNLDYCKGKVKDWSKGKEKIKELIQNKQAHYYLIEDWGKDNQFMVIMLRDVKRLDFDFAERMEKGISEKILDEEVFHKNDVHQTQDGTMVYKLQQVIGSPYLEHIMEAFSKNFCRIGIDRIDETVVNELINE